MAIASKVTDAGGEGNLLSDSVDVNILVLILFYSLARCLRWGKSTDFLQRQVNLQLPQNATREKTLLYVTTQKNACDVI